MGVAKTTSVPIVHTAGPQLRSGPERARSGEIQPFRPRRPVAAGRTVVGKCGPTGHGGPHRGEKGGSRPISRVLSWTTIHLGRTSPCASSDLPGSPCGPQERTRRSARFPIWSCSRWGLPCRRVLPPARCALTAPFHPCRPSRATSPQHPTSWAVCSLLHFPWARAPQALPGTLPCGARTFLHVVRRSGCLADSRAKYTLRGFIHWIYRRARRLPVHVRTVACGPAP